MATDNEAATEKIAHLRGVTWSGARTRPRMPKSAPGIGVIAQEVEKVFPELVTNDEQGRKKVEYEGLIGPLVEAVKELDDRVRSPRGDRRAKRRPARRRVEPSMSVKTKVTVPRGRSVMRS
jgi:Chaperone of endosialidase